MQAAGRSTAVEHATRRRSAYPNPPRNVLSGPRAGGEALRASTDIPVSQPCWGPGQPAPPRWRRPKRYHCGGCGPLGDAALNVHMNVHLVQFTISGHIREAFINPSSLYELFSSSRQFNRWGRKRAQHCLPALGVALSAVCVACACPCALCVVCACLVPVRARGWVTVFTASR